MTGTAVVKQTLSEMVVEGAGLDGSVWQPARVAALQKLLPQQFQASTENLIALASLVDRTGLDPFIKELYCWEDKGRVTYHVGRDGWLKIAKRDPDIVSVASGVIFENDEFSYVRGEDGKIHISHAGGFPQGPLVGAWALVCQQEGQDQLVTRELAYYKHLMRKDNWSSYPAEMLETRVIATAIKFVSQLAAGLYAPGEATDDEYVPAGIEATQARADTMKDRVRPAPVEAEVEIVLPSGDFAPGDVVKIPPDPSDAIVTTTSPPPDDLVEIPGGPNGHLENVDDPVPEYKCEFCLAAFDTPQGRSSHLRTHKVERAAIKSWKAVGYICKYYHAEEKWTAVAAQTGELVAETVKFEDLTGDLERIYTEKPDPVDEAANPVPEEGAESVTVTQVYRAMTEAGHDCDKDWLRATLELHFAERTPDGQERPGLFDLSSEERGDVVAMIRDTFGG